MAPRRNKTTLATVAAELGISRTSVSNAYNRPEELSAQLREQILSTAARLGYAGPDPTARSLRTRRTGAIGVLFTDDLTYAFDDRASVDFMAGMAEASAGQATQLSLLPARPDSEDTAAVNRAVVDGIVAYSVARDDPYLQAVERRGLPLVVCDQPTDTEHPFVGVDNAAAITPAAQALVDAGHTRIGILCIRLDRERNDGPVSPERLRTAGLHVQRDRVNGALAVFRAAGISHPIPIVERFINNPVTTVDAARELHRTHPELTAVLCTTDTMALGVLDYAASVGIRVPEDLSVVGFDGIAPALSRGLTTILQPNRDKGIAAGRMLINLIDNPSCCPEPIHLTTTLAPGTTLGPPRR